MGVLGARGSVLVVPRGRVAMMRGPNTHPRGTHARPRGDVTTMASLASTVAMLPYSRLSFNL